MSEKRYKYIPNVYPDGGPLYFMNDTSGQLPTAVLAFMTYGSDPTHSTLSARHLEMVREYGEYWIHAPCWDANPEHDEQSRRHLADLRKQIQDATTFEEVDAWIRACLEIGIDPY